VGDTSANTSTDGDDTVTLKYDKVENGVILEADDGTIDAYVVTAVSSGTLKIGTSATTATAWASGTNETISSTLKAYWTPATNANGTLTAFQVKAKDNGGLLSSTAVQLSVTAAATNDNPILDASPSPALAGIVANLAAPQNGSTTGSTLVSALVDTTGIGNFSDIDGSTVGMAITGINSNGSLWYSINGGTSWTQATGVSGATALTLTADANTRVYFQPATGYAGTLTDALTFKAWDGTSGTNGGMTLSAVVTPGTSAEYVGSLGQTNYLTVSGNYLYTTDLPASQLKIYDISTIASPQLVKTLTLTGTYIYPSDVQVSGNFAYVRAYGSSAAALQIIDISTPASASVTATVGADNSLGNFQTLTVAGNYAYLPNVSGKLSIVDLTTRAVVASITPDATFSLKSVAVSASGNTAYVAYTKASTGGLLVLDISNKAAPTLSGSVTGLVYAQGVAVSGNYAYVANGQLGVKVIDVSTPTSPTEVGTVSGVNGTATAILIEGTSAYVSAGSQGIVVLDLSNPVLPVVTGNATASGTSAINDIALIPGYALAANGTTIEQIPLQLSSAVSIASDTVSVAVTDTLPPTFDVAPAAANIALTSFDLSASINEGGTIYYVVVANNATAPSVAEIMAGQASGGGAALKAGNSAVGTTPFTGTFTVTGLTASTNYDVYVVAQDSQGTPNVMATAIKVDMATASVPDITRHLYRPCGHPSRSWVVAILAKLTAG
jgi:hypothetical protein